MPKKPNQGEKPSYHFFSSSQLHWRTEDDLLKLINSQKRADRSDAGFKAGGFNVYVVPLPNDSEHDYEIDYYRPQVEGTVWLFGYNYKTGETKGPWSE